MNLENSLLVQTPKLVSFGHPPMQTDNVGHTIYYIAATRVVDQDGIWRPTDRDVRMAPTHGNIETISEKLAFRKYIRESEFETREVFERETSNQNIGTRLDTTQLEKNKMTRSVDSSKRSKKHEPEVNPDPEPSSSDFSESSSSDSRAKKKKRTKKKKRRKHRKDDSSDPSLSDDYDFSDDSHYRHKRRKDKKNRKKDPIRLCATCTAKLLTTAYKSKIIRFKMDEDPLQRRIYFLTFIESLDMIFSQCRETCEVLLDYPKIGGDNFIEDYEKKAIRNLLHTNILLCTSILARKRFLIAFSA